LFTEYTEQEVLEILEAGSKKKKSTLLAQEEKFVQAYKNITIFQTFRVDEILSIIRDIKIKKYTQGDSILDDTDDLNIYYVMNGSIKYFYTKDESITIEKDEIFGVSSYFSNIPLFDNFYAFDNNTLIFSFKISASTLNEDDLRTFTFARLYKILLEAYAKSISQYDLSFL